MTSDFQPKCILLPHTFRCIDFSVHTYGQIVLFYFPKDQKKEKKILMKLNRINVRIKSVLFCHLAKYYMHVHRTTYMYIRWLAHTNVYASLCFSFLCCVLCIKCVLHITVVLFCMFKCSLFQMNFSIVFYWFPIELDGHHLLQRISLFWLGGGCCDWSVSVQSSFTHWLSIWKRRIEREKGRTTWSSSSRQNLIRIIDEPKRLNHWKRET